MRLPIILALIVVITLPKDVQGLIDEVSARAQTVSVAMTKAFARDDAPVQVAEARVGVLKASGDTQAGLSTSLR